MQTNEELEIKKENEDLKTRQSRSISLDLTDAQVTKIENLAEQYRMSSEEILKSFIGDLVDYHRNGADEAMLANDWFERAIAEKRRY